MTINGYATPEGTLKYRERFAGRANQTHFRKASGLFLSSIGIGTYLGKPNDETDRRYTEAVTRAVELGANVIDSAANYRCQRSERAIGAALHDLFTAEKVSREELLICTKGGYLAFDGQAPRDVRAYVDERFVKPGIADFSDFVGGSHCMTPAYLRDQLEQSLSNLGLDCIDVYYIHNPESQLGAVPRDLFDSRLAAAFEQLEASRRIGKIRYYGVATWNGFRADPESSVYHSIERMIEIATAAGGEDHGFRFIQLPFNLAMTEALLKRNQKVKDEFISLIEAASAFGISLIASASTLQGRVSAGLSDDVRELLGALSTDAQTAIQFVRSTPGITTALVGMSRVEHVEENLKLRELPDVAATDYARVISGLTT
ncbi:MAG: hypothetical protein QOH96_219 [Blastocatellia bacterium]|nr:hypothetical protein [Blastocatellia bacterium]